MNFADHFSKHAASYAEFRPRYPRALYQYLATTTPPRERAWDCATRNGQAANGLAEFFHEVVATDASAQQIEKAKPSANVGYHVAPAEESGLEEQSVDVVTVAQALHWFDGPAFFREATRVLRPGGVLALWAYTLLKVSPALAPIIDHYYSATTNDFWPPERAMVERHYRDAEFPLGEFQPPIFAMEEVWTLDHLLGYLRTWSATRRFIATRRYDPVDELADELLPHWGQRTEKRLVRWPLHLRVGRAP